MKADALKGHLDMLLLSALKRNPAHGYAIIEQLKISSEGVFDLPEGTIYPALHRLERAGLIQSHWSDATGRRKRIYHLSLQGQAALDRQKQDWKSFMHSVNVVVGS